MDAQSGSLTRIAKGTRFVVRADEKRFIVRTDEKLTAFVELERAIGINIQGFEK